MNQKLKLKFRELGFVKTRKDGHELTYTNISAYGNKLTIIFNDETEEMIAKFVIPTRTYTMIQVERIAKDLKQLNNLVKELGFIKK